MLSERNEGVLRGLIERGAVGLISTHDLALTRIVEEIDPPGQNFHFEDQLHDGKMSFDYRLRPGIDSTLEAAYGFQTMADKIRGGVEGVLAVMINDHDRQFV